jgi:hypothetical protein
MRSNSFSRVFHLSNSLAARLVASSSFDALFLFSSSSSSERFVSFSSLSSSSYSFLLVGMVWVGVGFRFENPHQAGLGFSGEDWVGVGFTVGF